MKKGVVFAIVTALITLCLVVSGCGGSGEQPVKANGPDVDLTQLSSTMVYSEVYNMVSAPNDYKGKVIRAKGRAASAKAGNNTYYAVIIADATACCAQGLEYVLKDGSPYPKDGSEITVEGVFGTYKEGDMTYCVLNDARLIS